MSHRTIDFSSVLASSVHDMKNGLCLLLQSIENLSEKLKAQGINEEANLAQIHYEASRLNTNILQLLAMYRLEKDALPLNLDEHYLDEVLEELLAKNHLYIENKKLSVEFDIQPELSWFFDRDLISNLLNDIFVNAMRYTKTKISINAKEIDGALCVSVVDDGIGYPEKMLSSNLQQPYDAELELSKTGLGIFFAKLIAESHQQNDKHGSIRLENVDINKGSVFTLVLP